MALTSAYGLTLADVRSLKLWEFNHLVDLLEEKEQPNTITKKPPEPGMIPVMT